MKNLVVLSIYIPGWLPVDVNQGFGFTKLSGYRRICIRTAMLLLLLFSFSYNFVYFEKSRYTCPLFQAGYLGDSDRPTCLSRTGRPCDFSGPNNADKCELVSTQGYTYNIFQAGQECNLGHTYCICKYNNRESDTRFSTSCFLISVPRGH
jgi:hypothetical protein